MSQFIVGLVHQAIAADISLFKLINAHHTAFLDVFFAAVGYLGDGWVIIPLFLALIIFKAPKRRRARVVVFVTIAFIVGGLANGLGKRFVDRPRPAAYFAAESATPGPESRCPFVVHTVGDRLVSYSFPSGHAHTAFSIAVLVVLIWGKRYWLGFVIAALVAYSRVYVGAHFPLDSLVGACMGAGITWAVWQGLVKSAARRPES
jgi:membrane-associated phospholipid phosphatase